MPSKPVLIDPILGPLTDDQLTRDVWVYQRAKGHRFSSDDMATAYVAWHAAPDAKRLLDLGCGLGSVLLNLAWKMPQATLVGIEAQDMSYELLLRNVARGSFGDRVTVYRGDLRHDDDIAKLGAHFDLITGTPPYFPPTRAVRAVDEQREFARIEYRGGVEAYLATGAKLLDRAGIMVLCGDARAEARVHEGASRAGLAVRGRCDVIARDGRPPLFAVWTFRAEPGSLAVSSLVLRCADGGITRDAQRLRAFSGFAALPG